MRAAYIDDLCSADGIRVGELPDPEPGPQDVLVAVHTTTVDPVDVFVRSGAYATELDFPFVIGRDLAGTVVKTGAGVTGFQPGERVWCNSLGHAGRQGAAAQLALVPADRLFRMPDGVGDDVVTVLHPGATAYLAVAVHGRVKDGETIVIVGAAGNVGAAAMVFARKLGARVLAVAHLADAAYCASLGADQVIDADSSALADRVNEAGGADVWLDTSGRCDLASALKTMHVRGRIVVMSGLTSTATIEARDVYTKDVAILGFAISNATVFELSRAAEAINRLTATGELRSRRVEALPLDDIADAHRMIEAGQLHGARVLITLPPWEGRAEPATPWTADEPTEGSTPI